MHTGGGRLSSDGDNGRAIHIGVGHAGYQIGGPWAQG